MLSQLSPVKVATCTCWAEELSGLCWPQGPASADDDDDDDCYFLLSSRINALTCDSTWVTSFLLRVFEYPPKWCTYSTGMAGATQN